MKNGNQSAFAAGAESWSQDGLTKREYYSGIALGAILINLDEGDIPEHIAKRAVAYADALLNELES